MKVGGDLESDDRRAALIRGALGPSGILMMDANQVWGVDEAIAAMQRARALRPVVDRGADEPRRRPRPRAHPRARSRPIRVATGEHVQNRVVFKQLFQAEAIDVCQLDACRVGGVNEALAILLLAAKFGIPVCPHAGGVGLCEYVQHLAFFDYIAVSGSLENRVVEWVDHLHEHFRDPAVVARRPLRRADALRATASRCCRSRSTSTRSRRAGLVGRRRSPVGGRVMDGRERADERPRQDRSARPLRAPPGRALVAAGRAGADPASC